MPRLHHSKNLVLPLALLGGAVFYKWMGYLTFLSPYLIFLMLFITYCKLSVRDIRFGRDQWRMLGIQMLLAAVAYGSLVWWNPVVAEGVFICIFVPTATAAPVITSMLGGSIAWVAAYSLMCNLLVAIAGPFILAIVGENGNISFLQSFMMILRQVAPLLLLPLATAMILRYALPSIHSRIVKMQKLSFYLWAISLFIIVGSCVSFAIEHWEPDNLEAIIALCAGALLACLIQFRLGRIIGKKFGDPVAGGQSLMQKNTVLAVWLALAYMNPIASIGPAAYIAWQNLVNSWQLARRG